jgi:hypothetical protein
MRQPTVRCVPEPAGVANRRFVRATPRTWLRARRRTAGAAGVQSTFLSAGYCIYSDLM